MKFVDPHSSADPDAAARKLVEIANGVEVVQDGRIYIELVNGAFLEAGGTPDQFRAALARAIALGWRRRFNPARNCSPLPPAARNGSLTRSMKIRPS